MPRPGAVLVALILALTVPAGAWAQTDSPFGPLPQPPQQPGPAPTPVPVPVQPEVDGGLEGWQQLALLGGAVLLLAAIATAIVRDARRSAPVAGPGERSEEAAGKRAERSRKRGAARRKGRAARTARKRNR